jgi:hypothetical protein
VAWSPDGARIVSLGWDETLQFWTAAGEPTHSVPTRYIFAPPRVRWSPAGNLVVLTNGTRLRAVDVSGAGPGRWCRKGIRPRPGPDLGVGRPFLLRAQHQRDGPDAGCRRRAAGAAPRHGQGDHGVLAGGGGGTGRSGWSSPPAATSGPTRSGLLAAAVAYGVGHEAAGSALQLVINLAAIVVAGVLTLLVQLTAGRLAERRRPYATDGAGRQTR